MQETGTQEERPLRKSAMPQSALRKHKAQRGTANIQNIKGQVFRNTGEAGTLSILQESERRTIWNFDDFLPVLSRNTGKPGK